MSKPAPWLSMLVLLPAVALVGQEVADKDALRVPGPDELKRIGRVPAPEIPTGSGAAGGLSLPEHLTIDNAGGEISGNIETGVNFSPQPIA